ncbi:PQQ-dependent sugar dehydrogenase [Allosphingosinicella flava]|uniref:PQQ-dependent sugar dehydrogenase n=1 Tax=Allosphingosinicella flava TaxID=2771430 RepID=A0A7T2LLQ5_9SPHN|nr:PQQ-dependent sugar dehydrogenase [Sphingosinicella flava]QPQ54760.1 PQQ-dependent sugar dehydrogenase [Sphingosinicella flava]
MHPFLLASLSALALVACNSSNESVASGNSAAPAPAAQNGRPFAVQPVADFDEPWAMTFLPDGRLLITEKKGQLKLMGADGNIGAVTGTPEVAYGGQGGLGDVVLHPDFANNARIYLSWVEAGEGGKGAVVGRGTLVLDNQGGGRIDNLEVIWRQEPKVSGNGHFSHRIAFSPDGYLFITSGERQKFDPAQDLNQNLGKVVRLTDAGGVPGDNPFYDQGRIKSQIWSYGHRNLLGIAFAPDGKLWTHEMGPAGGDEFNLIEKGSNYGYPIVSNGNHYDGRDIPDHATRPEFNAPEVTWNPVISPAGLIIYTGAMFPAWKGNAFIGGLSGKALVRVAIDGTRAREAERWDMGARIREVEQGPDGAILLLEDGGQESEGRLLRLTPAS